MLQVPVVLPIIAETTSLGAAYAAGLAVGFWEDLEELRVQWKVEKTWEPRMPADQRDELVAGWRKAVDRTLNWVD
jgi:glycerol kinase